MKAFYFSQPCSIIGYHAKGLATIKVNGKAELVHQSKISIA